MKAIQIKYLSATDTKGARLKIFAEGVKAVIVPRSYGLDFNEQAKEEAFNFAKKLDWVTYKEDLTHGTLPNGDCVATINTKAFNPSIFNYYQKVIQSLLDFKNPSFYANLKIENGIDSTKWLKVTDRQILLIQNIMSDDYQ